MKASEEQNALRLFEVISRSVTLGNHSRTAPTITEVVLLFFYPMFFRTVACLQ